MPLDIQDRIVDECRCANCNHTMFGMAVYELDDDGEPICGKCFDKIVLEAIKDNADETALCRLWNQYSSDALPSVTVYTDNGDFVRRIARDG